METCSPSEVPRAQSFMWSQIALAADMAEESFRACNQVKAPFQPAEEFTAMIAAPRCWIVSMNFPCSHSSSPTLKKSETLSRWILTASLIDFEVDVTTPWETSGYWVLEWFPKNKWVKSGDWFLPQMMTFWTFPTFVFNFKAIWAFALLWSRRVKAEKASLGKLGAVIRHQTLWTTY